LRNFKRPGKKRGKDKMFAEVEHRDMFWNRKKSFILIRMMIPTLFGFGKSERFKPDL